MMRQQSRESRWRKLADVCTRAQPVPAGSSEYLLRLVQSESSALAEYINVPGQFAPGHQWNDLLADFFHVLVGLASKLWWDYVCGQECGLHCARPAGRRITDGLQRFDLRFCAQAVARLGFDCCRPLPQHRIQSRQYFVRQFLPAGGAYSRDTRPNTATCGGNLLVAGAGNSFFKIYEPGFGKNRMGVAVNESGQNHPTGTIQFVYFAPVLPEPFIAQDLPLPTDGNNFPPTAEDRCVFNDPNSVQ